MQKLKNSKFTVQLHVKLPDYNACLDKSQNLGLHVHGSSRAYVREIFNTKRWLPQSMSVKTAPRATSCQTHYSLNVTVGPVCDFVQLSAPTIPV